ncbi:MAG TPA: hypothetical protein VII78_05565 [Myxococcota bacterium]|jgi:hypothetical protein
MFRRILPFACVLLLTAPLTGCWVLDEIDRGQQLMEEHSPKEDEKPEEKTVAATPQRKGSGKTRTFTPGQVSEGIVGCKLGGSTQFMTRENCAARGGRTGS